MLFLSLFPFSFSLFSYPLFPLYFLISILALSTNTPTQGHTQNRLHSLADALVLRRVWFVVLFRFSATRSVSANRCGASSGIRMFRGCRAGEAFGRALLPRERKKRLIINVEILTGETSREGKGGPAFTCPAAFLLLLPALPDPRAAPSPPQIPGKRRKRRRGRPTHRPGRCGGDPQG